MGVSSSKKRRLGLWIAMAAVGLVAIATYYESTRLSITSNPEEPGWSQSIAVLVFRDLSPDRDQEFLCSGIADDIIGRLATIQDLKVSSFQSTSRFIGTDIDRRSIGTELGVDHILDGSLQLLGEDLRIRVELFRVNDDVRLWSEEYKQDISSIFDLQDELASTVAGLLGVGENRDFSQRQGTDDIAAYNALVRGNHFYRYRNKDDLQKALRYFREAVSLDSTYALGWLGLYHALNALNSGWFTNSVSSEAESEKKKALENAIWFGEGLAEVHTLKGMKHWNNLDYEKAESEFLRAIDISPGYVWTHIWYANMLGQQGNQAEQIEHRRIALELDPVSPVSLNNNGAIRFGAGDFDAAKKLLEESISIDPKNVVPYWTLSRVMLAKGDTVSALATLDSMFHVAPGFWRSFVIKAEVLWLVGKKEESQELYARAVKMAPDIWQSHNDRGDFLLNIGMPEEAVNAYRKALDCTNKSKGRSAIMCRQLAQAFETAGHIDSALQAVEMGLDLVPQNEDLLSLKQILVTSRSE
jgi:TolB-like protein/Flp pilus assembly protein TadD